MNRNRSVSPLAVKASEAAKLLSVSPRTLWAKTAPRGPIRSVRIGRDHHYPVAELERFLREGMEAASCDSSDQ